MNGKAKRWAGVCAVGVSLGCSSGSDERLGAVELELSQGCRRAPPVVTTVGHIDATSPTTYNPAACFKGYVVQVDDYPGPSFGSGGGGPIGVAAVEWADAIPTTQAACEAAWIGAYLFQEQPDGIFATQSMVSVRGTWNGSCEAPVGEFTNEDMPPGATYKVTASARTAQTIDAPTRKVRVHTY